MPPPHVAPGFHTVTPYLVVRGAARALAFYGAAFGAEEIMRLRSPDGTIAHAEVRIGGSIVMLADESPMWGTRSPLTLGGSPVSVHLYVEDVDEVVRRALAAGARELVPVADQFYGDRSGRIEDPFGHLWIVATHQAQVDPAELQRRFDALTSRSPEAP